MPLKDGRSEKTGQVKVSIPTNEWELIQNHFKKHEKELLLDGIKSPTMLLRRWMLDKYRDSIADESNQQ
jgi:hypothetical protein